MSRQIKDLSLPELIDYVTRKEQAFRDAELAIAGLEISCTDLKAKALAVARDEDATTAERKASQQEYEQNQ